MRAGLDGRGQGVDVLMRVEPGVIVLREVWILRKCGRRVGFRGGREGASGEKSSYAGRRDRVWNGVIHDCLSVCVSSRNW